MGRSTLHKTALSPVLAPTLQPTELQFSDPIAYLSSPEVVALGEKYGLLKIVPPRTWKPPFSLSDTFTFTTRLQKLSDLGLRTRLRLFFKKGLNRYRMMIHRKSNLQTFFKVDHKKVFYYDLHLEVARHGGWDQIDTSITPIAAGFGITNPERVLELKAIYQTRIKGYADFLSRSNLDELPSPTGADADRCLVCHTNGHPEQTLLCDSCDNPFHMQCVVPALTLVPVGNWYCDRCVIGTGEYGFEEENEVYTLDEFRHMCADFEEELHEAFFEGRQPSIAQLEVKFWDLIENENALEVKYGADLHSLRPGEISGFPMFSTPNLDTLDPAICRYINHPFNLVKLPFARGSLLNYLDTSISGMTVPWIYVGSLFSTFCWHVEDHYTLSANYCHQGATKKWYGIPATDAAKFERLMRDAAPDLFQKQPDLLHQLVTLMLPRELLSHGITVVTAEQNPNEFVVTFPKVYHAGFNCGFNVNEAVNFTMSNWINHGAQAVEDYRIIKKENVFNFSNMLHNILMDFIHFYGSFEAAWRADQRAADPHRLNRSYLNLVQDAVANFKRHFEAHDAEWTANWGFLMEQNAQCVLRPRNTKTRSLLSEAEYLKLFEKEDFEPHESMCACCKTLPSYQYFLVTVMKPENVELPAMIPAAESVQAPTTSSALVPTAESSPLAGADPLTANPPSTPDQSKRRKVEIDLGPALTPSPSPVYHKAVKPERNVMSVAALLVDSSPVHFETGAAVVAPVSPVVSVARVVPITPATPVLPISAPISKMTKVTQPVLALLFEQPRTVLCLNDFLRLFKDPATRPPGAVVEVVIQEAPQDIRQFVLSAETCLNGYRTIINGSPPAA